MSNSHGEITSPRPSRRRPLEVPDGLSLSVIGTGYLGATHAVCMALLGHRVVGIDVDRQDPCTGQRNSCRSTNRG